MSDLGRWYIEPLCVFGGYVVARKRWVLDRRGEKDHEVEVLADRVYPTWPEAVVACAVQILR